MKKLTALSILFISLVFIVPIQVSAATNAGVKPGSFFYFFDTAFENVGLFFAFNSESKAKKALGYADERLAEIEAIAEEKNPDAVKVAITNYESNVALATEKSKEVKDKGQAENLFTLIEDSTSRNQEILSAVLIKVPEEAREAITKAIEASKQEEESATRQIIVLKGEIEQLRQEIIELRKENKEIANKTESANTKQESKKIDLGKYRLPPSSVVQKTENTQTNRVQPATLTPTETTPEPNYRTEALSALMDQLKYLKQRLNFYYLLQQATIDKIERLNDQLYWIEGYSLTNSTGGEFLKKIVNLQLETALEIKKMDTRNVDWFEENKKVLEKNIAVFTVNSNVSQENRNKILLSFDQLKEAINKLENNHNKFRDASFALDKKIEGLIDGLADGSTNTNQSVSAPSYPSVYIPPAQKIFCESYTPSFNSDRTYITCN